MKIRFVSDMTNIDYLEIQPKYSSTFKANVPISFGCNNFCTYCAVPYTRGREISRPAEKIIAECQKLINGGYKEITLLGQNVNSYGLDLAGEIKFPELLKQIDGLKGDFWLRYTSPHPKDMTDDLIKAMADGQHICRQLNLPVQSGDNEILKRMNRTYTSEHYLKLVDKIKNAIPNISLSTDVIVGFPGETKKQFKNTAKLFKKVGYHMAYLAQFSPRPGTPAAKMPDNVTKKEKKKREEKLNKILKKSALKINKKSLGETIKVLVDEPNAGRNEQLVKVIFNGSIDLKGKFIKVMVTKARPFGLEGKLINLD